MPTPRSWIALGLALSLLGPAPSAAAKPLGPGDVRVCGPEACEPIEARSAVRGLAEFFFAGPEPGRVPAPRTGARSFELRLRSGRVLGDVAGRRLDRMRVPRLNCDRFTGRGWYRLPPEVARELRALTEDRAGFPVGPPPRRSC